MAITNDLAAALCGAPNARLTETRRAFTNGVAWITYSETVGVRDALATAGSGFGDDISGYRDVPSAADSLRRKLQALRCLLVVDNATVIEQVTPFANALGPDCRLLVTARDASLAAGRRAVPVGVLDDAAVSLHLADWADVKPDQLPPEALEVARQCAGLPLATAVCGAMVSQGTPWSDLLSGFLTLLENGFREAEQETEIRIRTLSEIGARASALARFASALTPGDRERAQTAARDALAMMTPFNPEGDRYDTNATAGALEALVSTGLLRCSR